MVGRNGSSCSWVTQSGGNGEDALPGNKAAHAVPAPFGGALAFVLLGWLGGCGGEGNRKGAQELGEWGEQAAWEEPTSAAARPPQGTEEDWALVREKARLAWQERWDTLPMGESMALLGLTFVGTPYVPHTLELPGRERVVVNLQELDCVTLVENVLALARLIRLADPAILHSGPELRSLYTGLLQEIRYRGGRVEGYASRLHYFSDWIYDNQARGLVREITSELGGVPDVAAIDYMTRHPEQYPQMAEPGVFEAILEREAFLSRIPRSKIPLEDLEHRLAGIQNGDILAMTSTIEGLDVAHVGLALWQGGNLHLLHAPLVGDSVEVSRYPLVERLQRISGQDGVRVVRALPPRGRTPPE